MGDGLFCATTPNPLCLLGIGVPQGFVEAVGVLPEVTDNVAGARVASLACVGLGTAPR